MQRVEVEDFQGPIDLLLTLVQQEELSLTRIRLLEILNQVLEGLEKEDDLNESGDLLIIISTLMELKSKLLLPGEVNIGEEIQALKEDLLTKILVHRRLSQVLDALEYRMMRRSMMVERPDQTAEKELVLNRLEEQNPFVLFSSLSGILEMARQDTLRVEYNIHPIDYYFDWLETAWVHRDFELREVLKARKDLLDASGVLIAVLEMVRRGRLRMELTDKRVDFYWQEVEENENLDDKLEKEEGDRDENEVEEASGELAGTEQIEGEPSKSEEQTELLEDDDSEEGSSS